MSQHDQSEIEAKLRRGLQALDEVESATPSIEALTMLVQQTKQKQRNELYVFVLVALLITVCTVAFIVNLPGVYLLLQLLIIIGIGISSIFIVRKSRVKQYE
ncbi:hypothetical protein E2R51_12755 [Jeotgalibacillus sp. S-D1]|uniref:DUF5345 family protein n=1 Tax=Jeotgalibacillus sp. S-D1 TaxID=2552189 RepID=UPI00105A6DD1|nr:DUF5345 family protein [Jeotgalibacillus sp. S-D1]TDL32071.1 hypothetical protein E2R51_12755 [Jeotgalibacillus sp. S-D1]